MSAAVTMQQLTTLIASLSQKRTLQREMLAVAKNKAKRARHEGAADAYADTIREVRAVMAGGVPTGELIGKPEPKASPGSNVRATPKPSPVSTKPAQNAKARAA
jgi:hypothetical protein